MMKMKRTILCLLTTVILMPREPLNGQDLTDRVEHRYADSDGVKIHYVTLGEDGPLVITTGVAS